MILLYLLDAGLIYISFYLGYVLRFERNLFSISYPDLLPWAIYREVIPFVILVCIFFFSVYSLYDRKKEFDLSDLILSVFKAVCWAMLFLAALTFFWREKNFSRIALLYSGAVLFLLTFVSKLALMRMFRKKKRILIIGASEEALILEENYMRDKSLKVIRKNEFSPGEGPYDEIIVSDMDILKTQYRAISAYCHSRGAALKVTVDVLDIPAMPTNLEIESGIPLLNFSGGLYSRQNRRVKRIFDILVSAVLLVLFLPVMLLTALAIILDSGLPVFYFQERYGLGTKKFRIKKFRTMIKGAEILQGYMREASETDGRIFKIKNDPRLTRVGKIIRKFYIDEIPQLLNVLSGTMSLIGPRPLPESDVKELSDLPGRRYDVLPGITGLWQIHTEKKLSFNAMVRLDLYYIDNWSILLDLRIFLDTIPLVLFGIGGY